MSSIQNLLTSKPINTMRFGLFGPMYSETFRLTQSEKCTIKSDINYQLFNKIKNGCCKVKLNADDLSFFSRIHYFRKDNDGTYRLSPIFLKPYPFYYFVDNPCPAKIKAISESMRNKVKLCFDVLDNDILTQTFIMQFFTMAKKANMGKLRITYKEIQMFLYRLCKEQNPEGAIKYMQYYAENNLSAYTYNIHRYSY